jgi:uridylate kinase
MNCDAVLKGSQVDGVYSSDPKTNENASRFNTLTYKDVLTKDLKVMDSSAIAMARDNHLPIIVFSIQEPEALAEVVDGKGKFTIIS